MGRCPDVQLLGEILSQGVSAVGDLLVAGQEHPSRVALIRESTKGSGVVLLTGFPQRKQDDGQHRKGGDSRCGPAKPVLHD